MDGVGSYREDVWESSQVYGLAGEAMLNFGPLAVPVAFFGLGLLVARLRWLLIRLRPFDSRLLLFPFLVNLTFIVLVGDLDNILYDTSKHLLMPLLLIGDMLLKALPRGRAVERRSRDVAGQCGPRRERGPGMRLCVVLEQRFFGTSDGAVWTDGPCPCSFWSRYRAVFDEVRVIARVKPVVAALRDWVRADGEGVVFAPVPHYLGPWEYLRKSRAVARAVRQAVGPEDAVILRVSSNLAGLLFPALRRTGHPYAVEVLADPYDVFAPRAVRHPLRPWFRAMFARALRAHCRHACAAAYVTAETLQRRYPAGPGTYCVHYSDVQIDGQIAQHPRGAVASSPCRLVLVGTLAQLYKAPEVLIDAVAHCARGGLDLRLTFVGDGKYRAGSRRGRRGWDWAIASVSAASSRPGKPSARSWTVRICSCSRRARRGCPGR